MQVIGWMRLDPFQWHNIYTSWGPCAPALPLPFHPHMHLKKNVHFHGRHGVNAVSEGGKRNDRLYERETRVFLESMWYGQKGAWGREYMSPCSKKTLSWNTNPWFGIVLVFSPNVEMFSAAKCSKNQNHRNNKEAGTRSDLHTSETIFVTTQCFRAKKIERHCWSSEPRFCGAVLQFQI